MTLASLLALDLGSSNTIICDPSKGIVFDEPTLIAHDRRSGRIVGIGNEAKDVVGKVSGYVVVERPIRDGRIASVELLEKYLEALLKVLARRRFAKPKVMVSVTSASTPVETRSYFSSLRRAGFSEVESTDAVLASAVGLGTDVYRANGSMVVNIGGDTTLSGIVAFGEVVVESNAFCGGNTLDKAIMDLLRYNSAIAVEDGVAEELKLALASVSAAPPRYVSSLMGRDLLKGNPVKVEVEESSVRDVIADPIKRIIDVVLDNLSHCPAELAQDLVYEGLHLCGGASQLKGFATALANFTQIPVHEVDEPRYVLARGLALMGAKGRR